MSGTARQDVLLIIRAKDAATQAVDAASDALRTLFEVQGDVGDGAKATGSQLLDLLGKIKSVEKAYSGVDAAANRANAAFERQQRKLAETKAELAAVQAQIVGVGRAIAKAQSDIVDVKLAGGDTDPFIARLQAARSALSGLQSQEARLTSSVRAQQSAIGEAQSSLQQLGSIANAAEAALVGVGGTAAREMLEAKIATEKATAALREQAAAAREEVQARAAQGRVNALLGVRDPTAGAASESAAVFDEQIRAAEEIGRAAREVAAAETLMAQRATLLKERIDPLAAIQNRLNKELKDARDLYRAGQINAQELALAERVLAQNAKQAADALGRQGRGERGAIGLFGLKPYELTNLGYQINDVFTQLLSGTSLTQTLAQQGGQLLQLFPRLGSAIVAALSNPVILGAAAAFTVVALSIKKVFDEEGRVRTFTGALEAMADGARYDAQALSATTSKLDRFGMSAEDALAVVRRFLREGMNPAMIEEFGRAAQNLAQVLGGEVKDAAQQIAEGFSGSYDAIVRLDDAINFLTPAEREHIRVLYESGRATEARAEATKRFIAQMDEAAQKSRGPWEKAGRGLEKAWNGLLKALSGTPQIRFLAANLNGILNTLALMDDLISDKDGAGKRTMDGPTIRPRLDTSKIDAEIKALFLRIQRLKVKVADQDLVSDDVELNRLEKRMAFLIRQRQQLLARGGAAGGDPVDPQGNPEQKRLAEIRAEELAGSKVLSLEHDLETARRRGNAARAAAIAGEIEYQRVLRQTHDTVKAQSARRLAEQQENIRTASQQTQSGQALLRTANRYQGFNENNRNQRAVLMDLFREAGISIDPAKLAWCAAFINAVLAANGLPTAKNKSGDPTLRAADFKSYGSGVNLADAQPGDIVVLKPLARGMSGHVGLFSGFDSKGNVKLTAGNQDGSQAVSTDTFSRDKVVAVRRPGLPDQDAAFLQQFETQRLEQQQAYNESIDDENERRSRAADDMRKLLGLSGEALFLEERRQAVANAIWAAERQAARQGLELSAERRKEIEQSVGAEWDLVHARERATRPVDDLTEERQALIERMTLAQKLGKTEEMDQLEGELGRIDTALEGAIDKAIAFWKQWDHPESRTAITGLENLRRGLYEAEAELHRQAVDQATGERQQLLDLIGRARESGDTDNLARLQTLLPDVDARLKAAIVSAEQFWKRFNSPEARAAYLSLQNVRAGIKETDEELRRAALEQPFEQLRTQRAELQQQIEFFRNQGQMGVANELKAQLRGIDAELVKAIDSLKKFWTESTRPEAQATLLNLQNLRNEIIATQDEFRIAAGDIQQAFAGSMVNSVTQWAEAIAQGRNVIRSTWDMFLGFSADFLRQLATMLLQAFALKAAMKIGFGKVANGMNSLLNTAPLMVAGQVLSSASDKVIAGGAAVGIGAGALAVSAASLMAAAQMLLMANAAGNATMFHSGGLVGSGGGTSRSIWPGIFAAATRYHTGGIVGLRPREFPAILERGEEVLTRGDPRHILNGGGQGGGSGGEPVVNLKNVVVFDPAQVLSQALVTAVGERSLLTFVRKNSGSIRSALQS